MNILFSWNDSVNSAPASYDITDYKASIEAAGAQLDQLFSNINMTLTIDVGLGEVGGTALAQGDLGEGGPAAGGWQTYDQTITDLKTHTTNPADLAQLATFPSVAPAGLSNIWVSAGEQKAWGLLDANSREPDGVIGFSSAYTYAPASDPGGPGYDLEGLAEHEITHAVFGRIGGSPMQLVDYTSPGALPWRTFTSYSLPVLIGAPKFKRKTHHLGASCLG